MGNVTLSVTPQLITRRRENLDRVNADGLEAELRLRPLPRWELQASYLYTDSRVERTGLRVPQVPLNQGSLGISFAGPVAVLLQGRWAGAQFDDDLNQLPLRGYFVADLSLRRPFGKRLDRLPFRREPVRREGGHRPDADRDPGIAAAGPARGDGPAVVARASRASTLPGYNRQN